MCIEMKMHKEECSTLQFNYLSQDIAVRFNIRYTIMCTHLILTLDCTVVSPLSVAGILVNVFYLDVPFFYSFWMGFQKESNYSCVQPYHTLHTLNCILVLLYCALHFDQLKDKKMMPLPDCFTTVALVFIAECFIRVF